MRKGSGVVIGEDLKRMQSLQLEMLTEFDRVCRSNGINYAITCGTLLGGVRHHGFIPWDNDVDVAMLREDYEKFRSISSKMNSEICYFQDYKNDPEYLWGYGKLRKTGTKFVREGQNHLKFKTGVYIDIMPLDYISDNVLGQIINDFKCFIVRKILYSRVAIANGGGLGYKFLSKIPVSFAHGLLEKMAKHNVSNTVRCLSLPSGGKEIKLYSSKKNNLNMRYGIPKKYIEELEEFEFENHVFLGTKYYDEYLTSRYGNYMELPPEEKRVPKDPATEWEF